MSVTERSNKLEGGAAFEYSIDIGPENFSFCFLGAGDFVGFKINGVNYLYLVVNNFTAKVWKGPVPTFTRKNSTDAFEEFDDPSSVMDFSKALRAFIDVRVHGRTGEQKRDFVVYLVKISLLSIDACQESLYWRHNVAEELWVMDF